MRLSMTAFLLPVFLVVGTSASAQEESYELPSYTEEQRWDRAATLLMAVIVGDLAKQMADGMTASEAGVASGELFGPPNGWNNSNTPIRLLRGMYRNWMNHPDKACELLGADENSASARCNRPELSFFGDEGEAYGVTVQDFTDSGVAFARTIADKHGMDWQEEYEGDHVVITVTRR